MSLPAPVRKRRYKERAQTTKLPEVWVHLHVWQLAYAEWLANHVDKRLPLSEQLTKAQELAGEFSLTVSERDLRALKARKPFRDYLADMRDDAEKRARSMIRAALPEYVGAHRKALKLAEQKDDFRAMATISEPMIERAWPRKETSTVNTQINITLSPAQQKIFEAMDDDGIEILDAEIINVESDDQ